MNSDKQSPRYTLLELITVAPGLIMSIGGWCLIVPAAMMFAAPGSTERQLLYVSFWMQMLYAPVGCALLLVMWCLEKLGSRLKVICLTSWLFFLTYNTIIFLSMLMGYSG